MLNHLQKPIACRSLPLTIIELYLFLKESNLKIQTTIDKLLDMFEDTSKQLVESHFLQSQLSKKLDESQRSYVELEIKYESVAGDSDAAHAELQNRIANLEGLTNAYELDLQAKVQAYAQLEQVLVAAKEQLAEAKNDNDNDKFELENLKRIKHDLEAQRELFTSVLDNEEIKGRKLSLLFIFVFCEVVFVL